mgnify:CR=1 FL=1
MKLYSDANAMRMELLDDCGLCHASRAARVGIANNIVLALVLNDERTVLNGNFAKTLHFYILLSQTCVIIELTTYCRA